MSLETVELTKGRAKSDMLPLYDAEDLTVGGQQAQIRLGDQVYTLRITKQHKLLLTK
ncbi:MAG: hemin uptake protein HemP [Pseudomonadota bacterium]